jgi:hypothetical protein
MWIIELNNTVYTYNNMNELLSIDSELGRHGNTPWWDSSYTFRREITFGQNHDVIPEGYTCTFTMDTTSALQSGDDIRIVYQTNTQAVELDRIGNTWNTTNTKISFKIQSEIPFNTERGTGTYYVYYGNPQAYPPPADPSRIHLFYDDFNRANSLIVGNSWIEDEQNLGIGILRISENQLRIEEHQNEYAHAEHSITGDNIEISCRIKPDTRDLRDFQSYHSLISRKFVNFKKFFPTQLSILSYISYFAV